MILKEVYDRNLRVSKLRQNLHFWVNYPFKKLTDSIKRQTRHIYIYTVYIYIYFFFTFFEVRRQAMCKVITAEETRV